MDSNRKQNQDRPAAPSSRETTADQADESSDSRPANTVRPNDDDAGPAEFGGRNGLDPTRYGDWEKNGRCIDF